MQAPAGHGAHLGKVGGHTGNTVARHRAAARAHGHLARTLTALLLVVALLPLLSVSLEQPSAQAKSPASTGATFAAGSYIIDMGAFVTTKPTGLQPYGILYQLLVTTHTPVSWIIKDGKVGGIAPPGTGLPPLPSQTSDFSAAVVVDGAGTSNTSPVANKAYQLGAFVIPKEFVTPQVNAAIAMFPNVIVDKAASSFSAPVFKTLQYWPKAVLDAQNGAIAQGFYTNAGIPNAVPAYIWKSPSQLTPCDDVYVMPHADPTWLTHSYLKPFNQQGGAIWAGCHAVSVLENLFNPAVPTDRMNFLTTDGLVPFGSHNGGTPPYSYITDGSDPVMQIGAPLDAATQNGSEQIYLPKLTSAWRPTSIDVTWDATQADVPTKSPGDARVLTYGPGFGNPDNGLVMYEAGHSINKGTVGDVPAQRAFFNFLLVSTRPEKVPTVTVSAPTTPILSGTTATVTANITGGSPGYGYQWSSSCSGGSFSPASGVLNAPGTISTTYTAPTVTSAQTCNVSVVITDQCDHQPFGAASVQVSPSADLAITKTVDKSAVSVSGNLTYTLSVRNNGIGTAITPTVTDTLPPGTDYVSADPTPSSVNGQVLTWSLPDMPVNGTWSGTVTAKALTAGAVLTNRASVSSTTPDPNLNNNTATAISRVLNAGISIEKIARPLIVGTTGGPVTFEFVVHNTGTDPLTSVLVTDNPACTTITGPTGDLNHDGILAPKFNGVETEIWRYTCTRNVTTATPDVAQSASGWNTGVPSLDTSTYTKQDVVQVTANDPLGNQVHEIASTVVTISNPSIAVTKTLSPAGQTPASGDKATFKVTVSNTGNVPLVAVDTTDIWTGSCDTATLPTLPVGGSFSMTCDATVPLGGSATDNFGSGTPSYATGSGWAGNWTESENNGPASGNVQVVDGTAVRIPTAGAGWPLPTGYSLTNVLSFGANKGQITRSVDLAGKTSVLLRLSYFRTAAFNKDRTMTVGVSPDGGTTWTTQTIPSTGVEADDTGWSTLQMTVSGTFTANTLVRLQTPDDMSGRPVYIDDVRLLSNQVNSVTATARDEYGNAVTATATAPVQPGFPSLTITKATIPTWLRLGDVFDYTVTVTNSGTTFQSNINVTDTLPSGLVRTGADVTVSRPSYWTALASDGFGTGQAYNTGVGWVTGSTWTETNETTSPTAGKIQVSTTVGSPASSLWFNNPGSTSTTPYITRNVNLNGQGSAQLQLQCLRNSAGDSTDDILGVYVNDILVYEVNRNTAAAVCPTSGTTFGPLVTVPLPAAALVSNAPVTIKATGNKQYWVDNVAIVVPGSTSTVTAGNPPNLTSTGGNNGSATNFGLAPGASMTFTIPVRVDAAPADGLQFSNLAQTTSDQQTSPVSAAVTTPYLAPSFTITKVAIETWVNNADVTTRNVTYRIELTNTGNVALKDVAVSDPSCNSPPAYVFGDLYSDNRLQVGEIWRYECTRTVSAPISTDSPPSPVVVPNTATATMKDTISSTSVAPKSASAEVRVIHPAVTITPTPATAVIEPGATVAYTYTVTNTGDIGLIGVTPTAANCSPLTYQSGDLNGDSILNVTETWTYTCTTSAISSNQLNQTVAVTATDRIFASTVTDTKQVDVYVTPPLQITKSAYDATSHQTGSSIDVGAGNSITYTYSVTSPSATPAVGLPLTNVQVSDDKCSPVAAVMIGGFVVGDTDTDNKLDPGETWTFQCSGGNLPTTTTNHAYASGTYTAGAGGTVLSNQAEATVTVLIPQLTLGKEASSETVRTGSLVTYTFTVTNIGATSFELSGTTSYLGTPMDRIVDADGTITATTACSPISDPRFPHNATHDVNGNGVLDPGDMLDYVCTTQLTVDTKDAFIMATSVDTLGTSYTPAPALAQVFVIDPTFSVDKVATTSLGGPGDDVPGVPGLPVTYTFTVTHTTPVTGDFHDGLESLELTVADPLCDAAPTYVSGDALANGYLDPGEAWVFTCTLGSLPDNGVTTNTVTVTGLVVVRDLEPDGSPANTHDGLDPIVHTDTAKVSPSTKQIIVKKQGLNCDVDQPVCANNFPGTSFAVYASDPATGSPTGTALTNTPAGSATWTSEKLIVNHDYWLVETSAPAGFQLLAQPIRFHITMTTLTLDPASASSLITADSATHTITITDVPATPLPRTGGRGFGPYLGLGLLLIALAGLAYARPGRPATRARRGG